MTAFLVEGFILWVYAEKARPSRQRDRYLAALKAQIQQLQANVEQLTAEKSALGAGLSLNAPRMWFLIVKYCEINHTEKSSHGT